MRIRNALRYSGIAQSHYGAAANPVREAQLEREVAPWVRWLAKIGFVAKGAVYLLIGVIALHSAIGFSLPAGSRDAFADLAAVWPGVVALLLLSLGLCCYALWRFAQVVFGFEVRVRPMWANVATRFGCFCSGVFYGGLAIDVLHVLLGHHHAEHGRGLARLTAWTMHLPLGRLVIAGTGVGILIFAASQLYRAARVRVVERLELLENAPHRSFIVDAIIAISEFGVLARGAVFALIGVFLLDAAWHFQAQGSQGVPRALDAIRKQPYGHWLLALVALGLIAFGIFQFAKSRWHEIRAD